jgi:hypothetical protein
VGQKLKNLAFPLDQVKRRKATPPIVDRCKRNRVLSVAIKALLGKEGPKGRLLNLLQFTFFIKAVGGYIPD